MVKFLRKFIFYIALISLALALVASNLKTKNKVDPAKKNVLKNLRPNNWQR